MKKNVVKEFFEIVKELGIKSSREMMEKLLFNDDNPESDEFSDFTSGIEVGEDYIEIDFRSIDYEMLDKIEGFKKKYNLRAKIELDTDEGICNHDLTLTLKELGRRSSYNCPECNAFIYHSHQLSGNYYCKTHGKLRAKKKGLGTIFSLY